MAERRIRGYCALCKSRCGAFAVVDGDRLLRQEPDPDHPTGGALCVKGAAVAEIRANPNRLLHPHKRAAPKGAADPQWQRTSWHEALDTIAERLRDVARIDGPEAVAFGLASPAATPISDGYPWIARLARAFGTPNICNAVELCNWFRDHGHGFTFGRGTGSPDYANAATILMWGHNALTAGLDDATAIAAALRRGAALVIVDPRRAGFAGRATEWLRVRPGTDAALALALVGETIRRGLYDKEFVTRWTNASQRVGDSTVLELLSRRCEQYMPDAVEQITGVPAEQIRRTATLLSEQRPVAYSTWTGVAQHSGATQADRAIAILMAFTGSIDAPGGNVQFARPPVNVINGVELLAPSQRAKALDAAERPLGPAALGVGVPASALYRAILEHQPYRVRAFMAFGTNVLLTRADPQRGRAALEALDFYVHADPVPNASARFADILLPVNDSWEREGLCVGFAGGGEAGAALVQLRPQAVPSLGESRSDTWIAFQLAMRLGLGDKFWHGDIEAAHDHYLAPTGITMAMLREKPGGIRVAVKQRPLRHAEQVDGRDRGFDTPSRLVELYSTRLAGNGYDPLPLYTPPPRDPRFPLLLTCAKVPHYCQSQHRDIASLRRHVPEPTLELHPDLATEHGISEGDWVEVRTAAGRARFAASFNASLERSVVCGHFGWSGVGPYPDLVNYAQLTGSDGDDPISGSATHRGIRCRLERVR